MSNDVEDITNAYEVGQQVLKNMLVAHMLNPENDDFYIGSLTVEKAEAIFNAVQTNKEAFISLFWDAYHIAYNKYQNQ